MLDLVIVWGGIAGLTAAIYASRASLSFVVLEQDGIGGGQITSADVVDNYPGFPAISGAELAWKLKEHAESLGAEIRAGIVERIEDHGTYKEIFLSDQKSLQARTVIAAGGAVPAKLGVEGESRLLGRGVSYCAVCDGAFFSGQRVLVVGGGETAVGDALFLAGFCREVVLVHRRETFRASSKRLEKVKKLPNVKILTSCTVVQVNGEHLVESVLLRDATGKVWKEECAALFVAVGTRPATEFLESLVQKENGYVVASEDGKTSCPGLFCAGDLRQKPLRQVVTAAADGANALYSVVSYLEENRIEEGEKE
jgi:thioredoxin reductase (NADPH)